MGKEMSLACACVAASVLLVSESSWALREKLASPSLTHSYRCQWDVGIKLI